MSSIIDGNKYEAMDNLLEGKRVLITGGTRGIGAAIAARMCNAGANVTVTGTNPDGKPPRRCSYYSINFEDSCATETFAADIANLHLDILINNAGINRISSFEEIAPSDFDSIQNVNVRAVFLLCRAVIPWMKQTGWGRIVTISSIFGKISKEFRASYSCSKFAVDGMMTALAAEVARAGILVNCVAPGFVNTSLTRRVLGTQGIEQLKTTIPIERLARPEEIAEFVTWLAGPLNTYISGQNIAIDGGFTRV